jgi:hypothetical protein
MDGSTFRACAADVHTQADQGSLHVRIFDEKCGELRGFNFLNPQARDFIPSTGIFLIYSIIAAKMGSILIIRIQYEPGRSMRPSLVPQLNPGSFFANIKCPVTCPFFFVRLWAMGLQHRRIMLAKIRTFLQYVSIR